MYYYKQIKGGKVVSVESKDIDSVSPEFVRATKAEYDTCVASLPPLELEPKRDLAAEITALKIGQDELKSRMKKAKI